MRLNPELLDIVIEGIPSQIENIIWNIQTLCIDNKIILFFYGIA